MRAITKVLAGGVAVAALAAAAPAVAQYYPGYGYPGYGYGYPGYGNPVGNVINQVLGGPGYGYGGYGVNSQTVVNQCANAAQARLNGGYGAYGYGYGPGGYNNGYVPYANGTGRVLGISQVEPHSGGGLTVRGVASSGRYAYGYNGQGQVDLVWRCRTDFRGVITSLNIEPAQRNYGYNYTPWNYDYSQYGYRRY